VSTRVHILFVMCADACAASFTCMHAQLCLYMCEVARHSAFALSLAGSTMHYSVLSLFLYACHQQQHPFLRLFLQVYKNQASHTEGGFSVVGIVFPGTVEPNACPLP